MTCSFFWCNPRILVTELSPRSCPKNLLSSSLIDTSFIYILSVSILPVVFK